MSEELTVQDAISSIRSYYEKENAQLRSQLAEARAKAIEECLAVQVKYPEDRNGNLHDTFGFWCGVDETYNAIRAISPTTPAQGTATTPQPLDGVMVPQWALDWLFGAGPDKSGRHFDRNDYPDARGAYWWRSQFRKMIALSNPKPEE